MQRDLRLASLSREHHGALRLARQLKACPSDALPDTLLKAVATETPGLLHHFAEEERDLVPELLRFGEKRLVARLLAEHREMETLLGQLGNPSTAVRLGTLLGSHVRFEEREMFEVLQAHWSEPDLPLHS